MSEHEIDDDEPVWPALSADFDSARSAARSAILAHQRTELEGQVSELAMHQEHFATRLDDLEQTLTTLRDEVEDLRVHLTATEEQTVKLQAGVDAERAMRPTIADVTELGSALTDAIEQLERRTNQAYTIAVSASAKSGAPIPEDTVIDLRDQVTDPTN